MSPARETTAAFNPCVQLESSFQRLVEMTVINFSCTIRLCSMLTISLISVALFGVDGGLRGLCVLWFPKPRQISNRKCDSFAFARQNSPACVCLSESLGLHELWQARRCGRICRS